MTGQDVCSLPLCYGDLTEAIRPTYKIKYKDIKIKLTCKYAWKIFMVKRKANGS